MARMMQTNTDSSNIERVADSQPVFLLSSERSGSNLVRSILNTHTEISAPHPFETAYPADDLASPDTFSASKRRKLLRDILIGKQYSYHPLTVPFDIDRVCERVEQASEPSFFTIQEALYGEATAVEDTSVWVTKYPGLWDRLDQSRMYYDDLKIIYLVRDPRDVVLSFKNSNIKLYHPYFSAHRWHDEQKTGIRLLDELEDRIHLLRYEDLLQEPERTVREVCDFIGVEYEEGMLYYYETEDAQETSESSELFENLSVPIKSDNFDKFRDELPDEEVKLTEKITLDEIDHFGYDRVYTQAELERLALESEMVYQREDKRMERRANIDHWLNSPREQLKRHLTKSFTAYQYLRYGVLA